MSRPLEALNVGLRSDTWLDKSACPVDRRSWVDPDAIVD
jgi:hypothetical protein